MGDYEDSMGDVWREYRAAQAKRRAINRADSARLLQEAGVPFTSHNNGAHLRIQASPHPINFWPGTGLWVVDGPLPQQAQFGVARLLGYLGHKAPPRKQP